MIAAIDTEGTGLDLWHGCRPFLITACDGETNYHWEGQVNCYTRDVYWEKQVLKDFQDFLNSCKKVIMHNAKFDIRSLEFIGIDVSRVFAKLEETLIAAHCICSGGAGAESDDKKRKESEHGLKNLAIKYLDYWDDDEKELEEAVKAAREVAKRNEWKIAKSYDKHFPAMKANYHQDYWLCPEECLKYAYGDVERTFALWKHFKEYIVFSNLWEVYRNRVRLVEVAYEMERTGMYFYMEKAQNYITTTTQKLEERRIKLKRLSGIRYKLDLNKKEHLVDLLHHRLKIPVLFRTKKDNVPQVDKKALEYYINLDSDDPNVKEALKELKAWKQDNKNVIDTGSYIKWCDENSRIHSNCWITGTRETRQSFTDPAIQTIKKSVRKYFGPQPGYIWVNYDLVNIELRIWAYDTGNPDLIKAFEQNKSVHMMMAQLIAPLMAVKCPDAEFRRLYSLLLKGDVKGFKEDADGQDSPAYRDLKGGTFSRIYGATDLTTNQTYSNTKSKEPPDCCAIIDAAFPGVGDYARKQQDRVRENQEKYGVFAIHTIGGYRLDVPPEEPQKACNYRVQGTAGYLVTLAMIDLFDNPTYKRTRSKMNQQVHDSICIEIPIQPNLQKIIYNFQDCIETAGTKLIPTCNASYKLIINDADRDNPLVEGLK